MQLKILIILLAAGICEAVFDCDAKPQFASWRCRKGVCSYPIATCPAGLEITGSSRTEVKGGCKEDKDCRLRVCTSNVIIYKSKNLVLIVLHSGNAASPNFESSSETQ